MQTLIYKNQSLQNIDKTHAVLEIRKLKAANIYVCGLCHYLHKIYVISISIITEYILNTFLQNSGPGRGLLLGVLLPLLRLKISKDWNHETRTRCTGRSPETHRQNTACRTHLKFRLSECEGYVAISDHVLKERQRLGNNLQSPVATLICLFMVMQKSVMKYITKMGQNTGMLKNSKKEHRKAIAVALVAEYQNLNSGSRRMKGLNSSF